MFHYALISICPGMSHQYQLKNFTNRIANNLIFDLKLYGIAINQDSRCTEIILPNRNNYAFNGGFVNFFTTQPSASKNLGSNDVEFSENKYVHQCDESNVSVSKCGHNHDISTLKSNGSSHFRNEVVYKEENALIAKKKIPENYVKDTLLPHIESQIAKHTHYMMPAELCKLIIAYSKFSKNVRKEILVKKLVDAVKNRISSFKGIECVNILFPCYILCPKNYDLFDFLLDHLSKDHIYSSLETLNLLSILRVYMKLRNSLAMGNTSAESLFSFMKFKETLKNCASFVLDGKTSNDHLINYTKFVSDRILPRLELELNNFDSFELCDILTSIALQSYRHNRSTTFKDIYLLGLFLPIIETKYEKTSFAQNILNLKSLAVLNIYHEKYVNLILDDIQNSKKCKNLHHKYVSILVWSFSKYRMLQKIFPIMHPLIEKNLQNFDVREFSRLSQALPKESDIPERICANIQAKISSFNQSEFLLFFLGCIYRNLFPEAKSSQKDQIDKKDSANDEKASFIAELNEVDEICGIKKSLDKEKILDECIHFINSNLDLFDTPSRRRIVFLLDANPNYRYIREKLEKRFIDFDKEEV